MSKKEQKFYDALQNIFVGAKIDGQGGFINLMKIKSRYYGAIKNRLEKDINDALKEHPSFRDELFDKLWSFFNRYFTQNGSIYFNETAFHNNVYERVYTNEKDVVLFWKTQMLYYVKTDSLYQSMPIEFDGLKFHFDASRLESKKTNEKKNLVFQLKEDETDGIIHFEVTRSEKGSKTKIEEIQKNIQKRGGSIDSDHLKRAFNLFERQSEVDYFINKNAKSFLKEQFKLWSYQYFWEGALDWDTGRVNQLQILKDIAFKIIDFIAQFENELVKIWNKPKFVKNAHYVITLDKLSSALQQKVRKAEGYKEQVKEWEAMGIKKDNPKVPVDTKHFKDLELEILSQFDNLDEALDGWLIRSENYQALNTILPKFREKVQCIYIDPPFNTGEDFPYVDKFQTATWATLMVERLSLGKNFLSNTGNYFLHLDKNAAHFGRILLDDIMGEESFRNEIIWGYEKPRIAKLKFKENHDNILFYAKESGNSIFNIQYVPKKDGDSNRYNNKKKMLGDWWEDIPSYSTTMSAKERTYFPSQKPEKLLHRVINCSTDKEKKDMVMDFFLGSGSTIAVAHKLGKKWIGIEMADSFANFYEDIMTIEKSGEDSGLGEEKKKFKIVETIKETTKMLEMRVMKYGALGKMKMILANDGNREPTKLSRDVEWEGGGFFKYYELEQYEETLDRCKCNDGDIINHTDKSMYEQYVFLPDEKMLTAIELDYENGNVKIDLGKLYDDIDIPETLSNLTGKWIKNITKDRVIFTDNTEIDTTNLDCRAIKPLIWWEQ